ncbi:hypothetical protein HDV06_000950 [Boothiomyces sp. JEL0866]|nr:hypothetical protein HDV06_000950 [Boothiomyces sp. JEL0866]
MERGKPIRLPAINARRYQSNSLTCTLNKYSKAQDQNIVVANDILWKNPFVNDHKSNLDQEPQELTISGLQNELESFSRPILYGRRYLEFKPKKWERPSTKDYTSIKDNVIELPMTYGQRHFDLPDKLKAKKFGKLLSSIFKDI